MRVRCAVETTTRQKTINKAQREKAQRVAETDKQKQEMLRNQRVRDRSRCSKCSTIHGITPNIL